MTELQLEPLADYACNTGENPLYHPGENRVYWTDIPNGKLFRLDCATGEHAICYEGEPVGGFTLQADGALLLFGARGAVRVWRDGVITDVVVEELPDELDSRFNDVIALPDGSVFCGTMSTKERAGRLYHLTTDGLIQVVLEDVKCSNGLGFTPDRQGIYYTDSPRLTVDIFDFDATTNALANRRVFAEVPAGVQGEGVPDGLTVDAEGRVWSARWGGSCLVCYDPQDGREKQRIDFPVKKVSSVTFGGPDYADMYVTTAGGQQKETDGEHAGALYRVRVPGVRGVAEFVSRVGLAKGI